jgi:hypothetical protein
MSWILQFFYLGDNYIVFENFTAKNGDFMVANWVYWRCANWQDDVSGNQLTDEWIVETFLRPRKKPFHVRPDEFGTTIKWNDKKTQN